MTAIEGSPLPPTARHDADGNHIPPHIPEWRAAATPGAPGYDPDRTVRGREVERDQKQRAAFLAHLEDHRRRGEPAVTVEG